MINKYFNKIKNIQIYPSGYRAHTVYSSLISFPPKGYKFIYNEHSNKSKFFNLIKKIPFIKPIHHIFLKIFRISLITALFQKSSVEKNTDLVFSLGILYNGNLPWILEILDNPVCLTGYNFDIFTKNIKIIERNLLSPKCKKIICMNETSLNFMKKNFKKEIVDKLVLVRPAIVQKKIMGNKRKNRKIRILFMGSINNPQDFYTKGGLEAIEAFERIQELYDCELIIRCKVPNEIRNRISSNTKIVLLENEISKEKLEDLYVNSDIFLFPGHMYALMVILEAMSYGLPILTLDTYAVKDYIVDNHNGFIINKSDKIKSYNSQAYPNNIRSAEFLREIKKIDNRVIEDLVGKLILLIENRKLRKKLGENGQKIIREKFSIKVRNKKLKKLFDEIFL